MDREIRIEKLRKQLPYYELRKSAGEKVQVDWKAEWERFDARRLFDFDIASLSKEALAEIRERRDILLDGNQAALSILTRLVDGLCGYPITPSTPLQRALPVPLQTV